MARHSMQISLKVTGGDKLAARIRVAEQSMDKTMAQAMITAGGEVMRRSIEKTPLDTGELRGRAFVEGPLLDEAAHEYQVVVGYEKYGAPTGKQNPDTQGDTYALAVHERTEITHKVGHAKFLETALKGYEKEYKEYMAKKAREALK